MIPDFSKICRLWPWYLMALVIILLDQWTKNLVSESLNYGQLIEVLPVFDITLLHNYGAAFSFLDEQGGPQRWGLTAISFVVSVGLIFWWIPAQTRWVSVLALSLILAGAVGNLIDRALLGYVVDFIAVHYQNNRFPAFNVADSAISVGAAVLFVEWFILEPAERRKIEQSDGADSND